MQPCNCGETLTRSVHQNAANRKAATRTRAQVCERTELFIGLAACDHSRVQASNFPRSTRAFPLKRLASSLSAGECTRAKFPDNGGLPAQRQIANRPVRLSFGAQHHDWPATLSPLRAREP